MAILKFRIAWEEDDAIYRDIMVKHSQHFTDLHQIILKAFEFDEKHDATFFRSNEKWQRGREISKAVYEKNYVVPPLMMDEVLIGSEIINTNQQFVYLYDFAKSWTFLIQLIQVIKNVDADMELNYPLVSRVEGVGPMQYGTKGLLGPNFTDIEEKYDLTEAQDGFGEEGEDAHASDEEGNRLLGDLLSDDDADNGDGDSDEEDAHASDEEEGDDAAGMFDDSSEAY
jgi:Fe-S-cluster formation regulator IscX/YfhJ